MRKVTLREVVFCSTNLPLASTTWVWSIFSSHCPLSFKQCSWWSSATSTISSYEIFWERWESNPGQLGLEPSMISILLCCSPPIKECFYRVLFTVAGSGHLLWTRFKLLRDLLPAWLRGRRRTAARPSSSSSSSSWPSKPGSRRRSARSPAPACTEIRSASPDSAWIGFPVKINYFYLMWPSSIACGEVHYAWLLGN